MWILLKALSGTMRIFDDKKEPVWVFLEKEMREMAEKGIKPYNEKVGVWLPYLRDLRLYRYCVGLENLKKLTREAGPAWYFELSSVQRHVLAGLTNVIHQDLLEDLPNRMRRSLSDLGLTLKISSATLMQAMIDSSEDAGVFVWYLYTAIYKSLPTKLLPKYSMNAMILMSSLVFIDLEECIERLNNLVPLSKPIPPPPQPKPPKNYQPDCRYGAYLQKMYVPLQTNWSSGETKKQKHQDLDYKLRLRSTESYDKLRNNLDFLEERKERNKKAAQVVRVCDYKFWEPPCSLRNKDDQGVALASILKMMRMKAKARFSAPYKNVQYQVTGVAYIGGRPQYILSKFIVLLRYMAYDHGYPLSTTMNLQYYNKTLIKNLVMQQTGYIPINGGTVITTTGDGVTNIIGAWLFPKNVKVRCSSACDCLTKWRDTVMKYINESKCKCGHYYDFYYKPGASKEKYFYPPARNGPFWFDEAKIFQMDPMEDFIKDTVKLAVQSSPPTPIPEGPRFNASGLKIKDLLAAFLADLSHTPLLIPHLPDACLLNNLQEWVRKRVKGPRTAKENKQLMLKSQRNWVNLNHIDFRARAYMIPFTLEELENMNWSHRHMIQDLFNLLLDNFVTRNRLKQTEQTRLWWSTMKYDVYPSSPFLELYFCYMPGRSKDTFWLNPFSSALTPKYGAKTCPLNF